MIAVVEDAPKKVSNRNENEHQGPFQMISKRKWCWRQWWVAPQPITSARNTDFNLTTLLAHMIGLLRVPSVLIRKYTRNIQLWSWHMSIEYVLIDRVFDTQRDDPWVTIQRWPWLALPMNTTTVQVDNQLTHRHFNASRWKKNLMGTRWRRKCHL